MRGLFSWVVFISVIEDVDRTFKVRPIGVFNSLAEAEHFCSLPPSQSLSILRVANLRYSSAQMKKSKDRK